MPKLVWDQTGQKIYETGVKKCVLYPTDDSGAYGEGVAWSGITSIQESPSGAESNKIYADDIEYGDLTSKEEFGATIEAYTYPDEFALCDGTVEPVTGVRLGQQTRKVFGLSYVTTKGNDVKSTEYGYVIHFIYGAKAQPSEKSYSTINDNPDATTFSWTLSTTPVNVTGYKPVASITVDSATVSSEKLAELEEKIYGSDTVTASLPTPDELIALIKGSTTA